MKSFLEDKEFLYKLITNQHATNYARVTSLTFQDELPIEQIEGKIMQGTSSFDGQSSLRRTCTFTMVTDKIDSKNYLWSLNNKFKLAVGIENTINSNYPSICWFKFGTYVFTQFSINEEVDSYIINITGQDKMCLLNRTIGGELNAISYRFDVEKIKDVNGEEIEHKIPITDIVREAVHHFGGEPYYNININFNMEKYRMLNYNGEEPVYLLYDADPASFSNPATRKVFYCNVNCGCKIIQKNGSKIGATLNSIEEHKGQYLIEYSSTNVNSGASKIELPGIGDPDTSYYVQRINPGTPIGYELAELVYPEELILDAGDPLTTLLDKIKKLFPNTEYFYDEDGVFVFQECENQAQTDFSPIRRQGRERYVETPNVISPIAFSFNDQSLITQFNRDLQIQNIKNDFSVWGQNASEAPILFRCAIDKKPTNYTSIEVTPNEERIYYDTVLKSRPPQMLRGQKSVTYTIIDYDWREIIYQMAKDYFLWGRLDSFGAKVMEKNKEFLNGKTGYEQYYTDIYSLWRRLYNPSVGSQGDKVDKNSLEAGYIVGKEEEYWLVPKKSNVVAWTKATEQEKILLYPLPEEQKIDLNIFLTKSYQSDQAALIIQDDAGQQVIPDPGLTLSHLINGCLNDNSVELIDRIKKDIGKEEDFISKLKEPYSYDNLKLFDKLYLGNNGSQFTYYEQEKKEGDVDLLIYKDLLRHIKELLGKLAVLSQKTIMLQVTKMKENERIPAIGVATHSGNCYSLEDKREYYWQPVELLKKNVFKVEQSTENSFGATKNKRLVYNSKEPIYVTAYPERCTKEDVADYKNLLYKIDKPKIEDPSSVVNDRISCTVNRIQSAERQEILEILNNFQGFVKNLDHLFNQAVPNDTCTPVGARCNYYTYRPYFPSDADDDYWTWRKLGNTRSDYYVSYDDCIGTKKTISTKFYNQLLFKVLEKFKELDNNNRLSLSNLNLYDELNLETALILHCIEYSYSEEYGYSGEYSLSDVVKNILKNRRKYTNDKGEICYHYVTLNITPCWEIEVTEKTEDLNIIEGYPKIYKLPLYQALYDLQSKGKFEFLDNDAFVSFFDKKRTYIQDVEYVDRADKITEAPWLRLFVYCVKNCRKKDLLDLSYQKGNALYYISINENNNTIVIYYPKLGHYANSRWLDIRIDARHNLPSAPFVKMGLRSYSIDFLPDLYGTYCANIMQGTRSLPVSKTEKPNIVVGTELSKYCKFYLKHYKIFPPSLVENINFLDKIRNEEGDYNVTLEKLKELSELEFFIYKIVTPQSGKEFLLDTSKEECYCHINNDYYLIDWTNDIIKYYIKPWRKFDDSKFTLLEDGRVGYIENTLYIKNGSAYVAAETKSSDFNWYLLRSKNSKNSIAYFKNKYSYNEQTHWSTTPVDELPFWFEMIDGSGVDDFLVSKIGNRSKVIKEDKIKTLFYLDVPYILWFHKNENISEQQKIYTGYCCCSLGNMSEDTFNLNFSTANRYLSGKNKIDELITNYCYGAKSLSFSCIPIYTLKPNSRVYIYDEGLNQGGEYLLSRLSFPLGGNGTMSVTATLAPTKII